MYSSLYSGLYCAVQVYGFRISELQQLMVFAGRSKAGRKIDLRVRIS